MLRVVGLGWMGLLAFAACGGGGNGQDGGTLTTTATTSADSTDSTGTDASTTDGTGTESDTSTGDTSTGTSSDDSAGESDTTTGEECAQPECKLNGAFGFHVRIPVTWEAAGPVAAGEGEVRVTLRAVLGTAGTTISGSADVCEFLVPWYLEDGGNEKIDLDWRDADFPFSIPDVPISGTTCGDLPEQTVDFDVAAVQIGVDLPSPTTAQWPVDYQDVPQADHDADGRPAFTVLSGNGQTTSPAPLDMNKVDRAHFVYMATRVVAEATATMSDCDTGSGEADVSFLDTDVVACRVCQGDQPASCVDQALDCTQGQIEFLNGYLANYEVGDPTFSLARIDPNLDCASIATYF
jgi:hypothetical protein